MTNTENQAGDVPDRVFEITPDRQLVRVRGRGSTIHSGMLLARVRSWFVDETDDLTTPERDYKSAVTEADELQAERDEWKLRAEAAEAVIQAMTELAAITEHPLPWKLTSSLAAIAEGFTSYVEKIIDADGDEVCGNISHAYKLFREPKLSDSERRTFLPGEPFPHSTTGKLLMAAAEAARDRVVTYEP